MKLNESPFDRIKNGTKTIEFRLYDDKRKQIKVGDKIEFSKSSQRDIAKWAKSNRNLYQKLCKM